MKEFLEQLGFKDITPDNPFYMKESLNEYFNWDKPYHALYGRAADNGILTYILHGTEGGMEYIAIVAKYGHKWVNAHQIAPSKYIKDLTLDLITQVETTVLKLGIESNTQVQLKDLMELGYLPTINVY